MIEPTESDPKQNWIDLSRPCCVFVMKSARLKMESGSLMTTLVNAPHTAAFTLSESWAHPTAVEKGVCLLLAGSVKYWPPVARVDNVYGDRNLICTCPPLSSYGEVAE